MVFDNSDGSLHRRARIDRGWAATDRRLPALAERAATGAGQGGGGGASEAKTAGEAVEGEAVEGWQLCG